MKDYTFEKDKDFILNYRIKDNKIIIKYASGKIYENFYTRELEKDILEKMKQQVLNFEEKVNQKKDINSIIDILSTIISISGSCIVLPELNLTFSQDIILGVIIYCITAKIPKIIRDKKIKDYEKNKLFVSNIELFQDGIQENMGMYKNLDRKSKKYLKTVLEKKEVLKEYNIDDIKEPNINSIDKISYESIKNIHNLLEENEKYSKYYNKEKLEPKKRVLSK